MSVLELEDLSLWPGEAEGFLNDTDTRREWHVILTSGERCPGVAYDDAGKLRCLRMPDHTGPCCNFKSRMGKYRNPWSREMIYEVSVWTNSFKWLYGEVNLEF